LLFLHDSSSEFCCVFIIMKVAGTIAITAIFLVATTTAFVLDQSPVSSTSATPTVKINLYYESLCPYCRNFIVSQLGPTFTKFKKYLDVELNPYGNARMRPNPYKKGQYIFNCQHGEPECRGSIMEACIIDKLPTNHSPVPVVYCIEKSSNPSSPYVVQQCLKQKGVTSPTFEEVQRCANGPEGNAIFAKMGKQTPPHGGVPFVIVNGHYDQVIINEALRDLSGMLCRYFLRRVPECGHHY